MKIRIKFPVEALDFIENLDGFEMYCSYYCPLAPINSQEWGRIIDDEKEEIIYFDCVPKEEKDAVQE